MRSLKHLFTPGFLLCLLLPSIAEAQQVRESWRVDNDQLAFFPTEPVIASEGNTSVIAWLDGRDDPAYKDIFVRVSTDGGLSWGPERQATQSATLSLTAGDVHLRLEQGIIHLAYKHILTAQRHDLVYRRSVDLGQSWSSAKALALDVEQVDLEASLDEVLVSWSEVNGSRELYSRWSVDQGANFESATAIQNTHGVTTFDTCMSNGIAHVAYVDNRSGDLDLYREIAFPHVRTWGSGNRLDQAPANEGTPWVVKMTAIGADVYTAWQEYGRQGSNNNDGIYFRRFEGGVLHPEIRLGQYTFGVDDPDALRLAASSNVVAATWRDRRSGSTRCYVAVSQDQGASFLPDAGLAWSSGSANRSSIAVEGNKIVLVVEEVLGQSSDALSGMVSVDAGSTWSTVIPFSPNMQTGQELFFQEESVRISHGSILATWRITENNQSQGIHASGMRLPIIEYQPPFGGPGKSVLHMDLIDQDQVGQLARWAASSKLGQSVHPENPALVIQLGASGILNQSLAKYNLLTAAVLADGTAKTKPFAIKPSLIGRTMYFQGWIDENGLGQPPTDVISAVLQ